MLVELLGARIRMMKEPYLLSPIWWTALGRKDLAPEIESSLGWGGRHRPSSLVDRVCKAW